MRVSGIEFFDGTATAAVEAARTHCCLVLAPSGPGLAGDLVRDATYRAAVQGADIVLPDSGAMVMVWNLLHCFRPSRLLRRVSGLAFFRALLDDASFKSEGATFWVMASERDLARNVEWLRDNGLPHLSRDDCYVAPLYGHGSDGAVKDPELLRVMGRRRPRYVILNIGGGTQEQLGWWLRANVSQPTTIICTGAAVAFLSGIQANIPSWADRFYLGWLLRCLFAPSRYLPRYWEAKRVLWIVLKHGSMLPPKEG